MAISASEVKTLLQARFADQLLAQLTNQYQDANSSDVINDVFLEGAVEDANLMFEILAAADATISFAEDKMSLIYLTMFFLYLYAQNNPMADKYLSLAKVFTLKAFDAHLKSRFPDWNDEKYKQELTIRQYYVQMLPTEPSWYGYQNP